MTKRKPMTKSQILNKIAEDNELPRKTVVAIFTQLSELIVSEINPKSRVAPGMFTIPGIARVKTRKKPAKKARKGTNPFTGEEMMFKAKPASVALRILPVKALKDAVN